MRKSVIACAALIVAACSGGGGSSGSFRLIEFLEAGQNNIPRNRQLSFRFSEPVAASQDFSTRLRIQNVIQDDPANFARARGFYLVNGDEVVFTPRLPQTADRSDAGFKENGSYHVFLSGGPDGLRSTSGGRVPNQQEFVFETNIYFEDIIPAQPPRSVNLVAYDRTDDSTADISRLDPRPEELAKIDNATLIANGRIIDPGAGGPPEYGTPWHFDLRVTEPIDPASVTNRQVEMHEIYSDAMNQPDNQSSAGWFGTAVSYRVAVTLETLQSIDPDTGEYDLRIRVTPQATLVDNTRYRLRISGEILGLDFRKTFSGDNGLTGDGQTEVNGTVYDEPGGLGYVTEFLVADRPAIRSSRVVSFDPLDDGIEPEFGQTNPNEAEWNTALYNPSILPGHAVGFLSAFGQGLDGDLAISGDEEISTGDIPNEPLGNPFTVIDLNPDDDYLNDTRPGGPLTYDSYEPFELQLSSLTVSSSAKLKITGVNPIVIRVTGIVTINGLLDVSGEDGVKANSTSAAGGSGGAGGFAGASSFRGDGSSCLPPSGSGCQDFDAYLNQCSNAAAIFPTATNGEGPGRGLAGGEIFAYPYDLSNTAGSSGGGGASHATQGTRGEDRMNLGQTPGTSGTCDNQYTYNQISLSSVIGVRGYPGPTYGDREIDYVNMGGSGGGAGGAHYQYYYAASASAGGGGGGGGGSLSIISAGSIFVQGGQIDVSGGSGGNGRYFNAYPSTGSTWGRSTGGGGGGAGGSLALISGAEILLTAGIVDARGGRGGARGNAGSSATCNACSAGGDGGNGFIFMMDADGEIEGYIPNRPGEYDTHPMGVLTISEFNADRFSSITAVTELFPMPAANPAYENYDEDSEGYLPIGNDDIVGVVAESQTISVVVSSAKSDSEDPLLPDLASEITPFEVAMVEYRNGAIAIKITGDLSDLNVTPGAPDREAFVRVQAKFNYTDGVQAALGPYASIDRVTIGYSFNG
ncbi:MAG: hypothetical protein ACYTHK_15350 [Planctomycetota bacterium]|jgi:hypothetical protein